MNAFERHNIAHLSASSLNTFAAAPSLWVMEKLLGHRGKVGCAAHRGSAVEAGISHGLFDKACEVDECIQTGLRLYDRLSALSGDPKREGERQLVSPMIEQGLATLRERGAPIRPNSGDQHKIEVRLEGVSVPIIGYLDFEMADEVLDTKTTTKIPSALPPAHARQFSIYKHAKMDKRMRGVYVSAKRVEIHTLTREQYDVAISEVTAMAKRMERFLAISNDPCELASIVPHSTDSYFWSDSATAEKGREIFGY